MIKVFAVTYILMGFNSNYEASYIDSFDSLQECGKKVLTYQVGFDNIDDIQYVTCIKSEKPVREKWLPINN